MQGVIRYAVCSSLLTKLLPSPFSIALSRTERKVLYEVSSIHQNVSELTFHSVLNSENETQLGVKEVETV